MRNTAEMTLEELVFVYGDAQIAGAHAFNMGDTKGHEKYSLQMQVVKNEYELRGHKNILGAWMTKYGRKF